MLAKTRITQSEELAFWLSQNENGNDNEEAKEIIQLSLNKSFILLTGFPLYLHPCSFKLKELKKINPDQGNVTSQVRELLPGDARSCPGSLLHGEAGGRTGQAEPPHPSGHAAASSAAHCPQHECSWKRTERGRREAFLPIFFLAYILELDTSDRHRRLLQPWK